jgi:aldehyde:ferredoxin oxidoreductase
VRAGWSPAEDTLPPRLLSKALADDPAARLTAEQLSAAIAAYNTARGWTAEGRVPAEQLAMLDLL